LETAKSIKLAQNCAHIYSLRLGKRVHRFSTPIDIALLAVIHMNLVLALKILMFIYRVPVLD